MLTDWTQTDPYYFYTRGLIAGAVLSACVAWVIILTMHFDNKDKKNK